MIEGRRWGFYTETGFIDFENFSEAIPLYDIHKPTVRSTLHVNFSIPKNNEDAYSYVDAIYNVFGIENAQLLLTDDSINGRIKMANWKVTEDLKQHIQKLLELNSFTLNGEMQLINHELQVICFDKRVVVLLGQEYYEQLSELAKNKTKPKVSWDKNH